MTRATETGPVCVVPSTLLSLVQMLSDVLDSDDEVAEAACELVNRGAVRLTGALRGQRIELPDPP